MTKEQAWKKAKELRKLMKSPADWKICVHENIGWHYSLQHKKGYFSIHPTHDGFYCAVSEEKNGVGTPGFWCDNKQYKDPNRAVRRMIRIVRRHAEWVNEVSKTVLSGMT